MQVGGASRSADSGLPLAAAGAAAAAAAGSARFLLGAVLGRASWVAAVAHPRWTTTFANNSVLRNDGRKLAGCRPIRFVTRDGVFFGPRGRNEEVHWSRDQRRCRAEFGAQGRLAYATSVAAAKPYVVGLTGSSAACFTDGPKMEDGSAAALDDFIFDASRTTVVAHRVWQHVARPGDTVIDATCGNGHDTLMLAKMVLRDGTAGYVIGLDLQQSALDSTDALLDRELSSQQREKVNLLQLCHSHLGKVVDDSSVRLIVFNLGYQPGGDKSFTTCADTTVRAVAAAARALEQHGLISIMSYVGHPGGREEHEAVQEFVSALPADAWVCTHLEWKNRPLCPHLTFLVKR